MPPMLSDNLEETKTMYTLQRKTLNMIQGADPRVLKLSIAGAVGAQALMAPAGAMATGGTTGGVEAECSDSTRNVIDLVQSLIGWAMALGGILVVVLYILAGIQWMAAGGNQGKVQKATNMIKNATIGLIILAVAFLIRNVILDLVAGGADGNNNVGALRACDE
jgi:cytochrome bd-type quinol oxidase subunit 2